MSDYGNNDPREKGVTPLHGINNYDDDYDYYDNYEDDYYGDDNYEDDYDYDYDGYQKLSELYELYNPQSNPKFDTLENFRKRMYWAGALNHPTALTPISSEYGKDKKYDILPLAIDTERGMNVNEQRAYAQTGFEKIGNGLIKMGVLTATTFVDSLSWLLYGILSAIPNAFTSDSFGEWVSKTLWDTPLNQALLSINEASESIFPNYYTTAELQNVENGEWYKNIFTANFIGDKFLKNVGFTLGAAGAAMVTGGISSAALGKTALKSAYKTVASIGKEALTAKRVVQAAKTGQVVIDGIKITEGLANAAKTVRRAEVLTKIAGSVLSAAGEAQVEALSNTNEWAAAYQQEIELDYQNNKNRIYSDVYNKYIDTPDVILDTKNEFGKDFIRFQGEAEQEYNLRLQQLEDEKNQRLAELEENKAKMGNMIFGLNMLVLSGSNYITLGRFMTGGYRTERTLGRAITKATDGTFRPAKTTLFKGVAKSIGVALSEGNEEMAQASIAKGAGAFYSAKMDTDEEANIKSALYYLGEAFLSQYGDIGNYEEGAIGFLTAFLGVPTIRRVETSTGAGVAEGQEQTKQKNRARYKISIQGEVYEQIKDALRERNNARELANQLNKRISSPDFRTFYESLIRHNVLQREKDQSLKEGNIFDYKNANSAQILSDVLMFQKAGRLQDLIDLINDASTITEEDAAAIRASVIDKETKKSIFDSFSDAEIVETIKKHGEELREAIKTISQTQQDIITLMGNSVNEDAIDELTYLSYLSKDMQSRFTSLWTKDAGVKNMLDKIKNITREKIKDIPNGEDLINIINTLTGEPENILMQPNTSNALAKIIAYIWEDNNIGNNITPEEMQDIQDLANITALHKSLVTQFSYLVNNPGLFSTIWQVKDKARQYVKNYERQQGVYNKYKDIKNINDLRNLIKDEENKDDVINILKNIDNDDISDDIKDKIKNIANTYDDLNKLKKILAEDINDETISSDINNAIDNAEDIDGGLEAVSKYVDKITDSETKNSLLRKLQTAKEEMATRYNSSTRREQRQQPKPHKKNNTKRKDGAKEQAEEKKSNEEKQTKEKEPGGEKQAEEKEPGGEKQTEEKEPGREKQTEEKEPGGEKQTEEKEPVLRLIPKIIAPKIDDQEIIKQYKEAAMCIIRGEVDATYKNIYIFFYDIAHKLNNDILYGLDYDWENNTITILGQSELKEKIPTKIYNSLMGMESNYKEQAKDIAHMTSWLNELFDEEDKKDWEETIEKCF